MSMIKIIFGIIGVVGVGILTWFFFFRGPATTEPVSTTTPSTQYNNLSEDTGVTTPTDEPSTNINIQTPVTTTSLNTKIFKIGNGPIAGATIIQTLRPTTTIARYVQQNNGHVFDIALNSSGAVPRSVSNTTIPGIVRVLWTEGGDGAILQYIDNNIIKTVHLGFPAGQSTTTRPTSIKFLPDDIQDLAVSPNGAQITYVLKKNPGITGYVAKVDGTESKEVFTIPLREVLISWSSPTTLIAASKSAAATPGIAFSINASSGAVLPLLYAPSLTLTANPTFTYVVYQTGNTTYARNITTGKSLGLSFDPFPEKCIWGVATSTYLYCAAPITYTEPSYLDMWHQGVHSVSDSILLFDVKNGKNIILATPGSDDGGVDSTIHTMVLSKDEKYLLFTQRGDYSLFGVKLQ